jgi:hypothetical protein
VSALSAPGTQFSLQLTAGIVLACRTRAGFREHIMVITQHAIALKDVHDGADASDDDFDDVIAMHDVESFRDLSILDHCSTSILWDEGPGLIALSTDEFSYNAGRKYCFQQLGPLQLGGARRKGEGMSMKRTDSAVKSDVLRRTRSRAGLNIVPDELSWKATPKELQLKDVFGQKEARTVTVKVYAREAGRTRKAPADDASQKKDLQDKMVQTWAEETIGLVLTLVEIAKREQILINNSQFHRSRLTAKKIFASDPFQIFVAFLITSNFIVNAFESGNAMARHQTGWSMHRIIPA